jgi:SAM-dependent methyltransferase
MPSDQELFSNGLATYQKVVSLNYMAHGEAYGVLRQVLATRARDPFVFLDIACGPATASAAALRGTRVGRYVGIDISQSSLDVAREALSDLGCPVDLRCQDFVEAIEAWDEPVDVAWIGQSLHHLHAPQRRDFMRRMRAALPRDGLFLIWEPTCLDGGGREDWLDRFHRLRPEWSAVTDDEFAEFESHCRASDYAEASMTWKAIGRDAGFARVEELLTVPNWLARVYLYSA